MAKNDVILNKAKNIERCIARIKEEYLGHESSLESDFSRQDAIILNIQRACEAAIDMAAHIVKQKNLGLPNGRRELFAILAEQKILSKELSTTMQKMVGFRNIAVHDYEELDIEILRFVITFGLQHLQEYCEVMLRL